MKDQSRLQSVFWLGVGLLISLILTACAATSGPEPTSSVLAVTSVSATVIHNNEIAAVTAAPLKKSAATVTEVPVAESTETTLNGQLQTPAASPTAMPQQAVQQEEETSG